LRKDGVAGEEEAVRSTKGAGCCRVGSILALVALRGSDSKPQPRGNQVAVSDMTDESDGRVGAWPRGGVVGGSGDAGNGGR
jgi:hypothetical protein